MKYIRYRFKTHAVDDCRPLIDMKPIHCPWWCTGYATDDSYATIVCYLLFDEDLLKYWDDAYDIDTQSCDAIEYTSRFPKPDWMEE